MCYAYEEDRLWGKQKCIFISPLGISSDARKCSFHRYTLLMFILSRIVNIFLFIYLHKYEEVTQAHHLYVGWFNYR